MRISDSRCGFAVRSIEFAGAGDQIAHGRLQAAEAEVEPVGVVQQRPRKAVFGWVAAAGRSFDRRPAGIRQAEQAGDFVERLAGRIVDRAAQRREIGRAGAAIEVRMAAAYDQANAGKHIAAAGQPAGVDVGLQMIDRHQRQIRRPAQIAFAAVSPTSSEPARPGVFATATASKSASVRPALRSASSITGRIRSTCARDAISGTTPPNRSCKCILRGDDRREHFQPVGDDGRRRFVARGFDRQQLHGASLGRGLARTDMMHPRRRHIGQHQVAADFVPARNRPALARFLAVARDRRANKRATLARRTATYSKKLSVPPGASKRLSFDEDLLDRARPRNYSAASPRRSSRTVHRPAGLRRCCAPAKFDRAQIGAAGNLGKPLARDGRQIARFARPRRGDRCGRMSSMIWTVTAPVPGPTSRMRRRAACSMRTPFVPAAEAASPSRTKRDSATAKPRPLGSTAPVLL